MTNEDDDARRVIGRIGVGSSAAPQVYSQEVFSP
jgi:hypothetical protein